MNFQPRFLRIATPPIVGILIIIASAAGRPTCAAGVPPTSSSEVFVLEQLQKGEVADLEEEFPKNKFPQSRRELSASFIVNLLTSRDPAVQIHPHGIWIRNAVITEELDLINQEIRYDVSLDGCVFEKDVDLTGSHFAKGLALTKSTFKYSVDFSNAIIGFDFNAEGSSFASNEATFLEMQVGRDFRIGSSTFDTRQTSFASVRVGGDFYADSSTFRSENISFDGMRVEASFSAQHCAFTYDQVHPEIRRGSFVSFNGARFADVFLNDSSFDKVATIDFTRMRTDSISFDHIQFKTPSEIKQEQMAFKLLSPMSAQELQFLLSPYDAEFYTALETSFRIHGYTDAADDIFIAKERGERAEHYKSFWRDGAAWAWSFFKDKFVGYGKHLDRLLIWSGGFLLIGMFVFWGEKGMRLKDTKYTEHYAGRYHAFWYSLDLFLPIIKLGEADVWTPKDDRRWANLYRKVHIIIGTLFVPIGLAAWTGIIK